MKCSSTVVHSARVIFILCVSLYIVFRILKLSLEQYQLALHQIDSLRKDGKFVGVDGSIPEGQGIVMAHLNECHELLEMVRRIVMVSGASILTDLLQLKESMDEGDDEEYDEDEYDEPINADKEN